MSPFVIVVLLFNLSWTLYLTYLVYKKNQKRTESATLPEADISSINPKLANSITKLAIIRYNPFDDLGGDQSFVLALLDNSDSGVIITSLHNRDNTRIYAKAIKNGQGEGVTLSREEKMAILKAIKV